MLRKSIINANTKTELTIEYLIKYILYPNKIIEINIIEK